MFMITLYLLIERGLPTVLEGTLTDTSSAPLYLLHLAFYAINMLF